ncbi:MAG: hypothetical protein GX751_00395 [Desulfuromonadaceae bacterium]|nr:hypothetical protein [Desulfuromonadaceae bacterium]
MEAKEYRIRKALVIPHLLCSLLAIGLLGASWRQGEPSGRLFIPALLALLFTALAVNILFRRLRIDEKGITQHRLYGPKTLSFAEINRFDATRLRKRVFFALSSAESYLLFSNAYGDLRDLIRTLCQHLPAETIGEDILPLADNPPLHLSSIVTLWLMAGILGVGIFLQIGPQLS